MIPYFLIFYFFLILSLAHEHKIISISNNNKYYFITLFIIGLSIYIGLRDNVGGDWGTYYENYFINKNDIDFDEFISIYILKKDFLFEFFNFLSNKINKSYYLVNFFFAIIFSYCLVIFSFNFKRPFFALLISSSYLIPVVSMGYHRQALALAFFLIAIIQLEKNNYIKFYFIIIISILFHYTAVFLFLFGLLAMKKIQLKWIIFFSMIIILFTYFIIGPYAINSLFRHYIFSGYSSLGALPRVLISFLPALIYFYFRNNFNFNNPSLVKSFSLISLGLLALLIIFSNATTFVDRLALYLIPFQIIIYDKFIDIFEEQKKSNLIIFYLISLFYLLTLIIWAYFGNNSLWWHPYKNIIFNLF